MKLIDPLPQACVAPIAKFEQIEHLCTGITVPGAVIQVGVWRGGLAAHLLNLFPDRRIYLADTFTGIPYHEPCDGDYHNVGDFGDVDFNQIQALFAPFPNVALLKGIFPPDDTAIKAIKYAVVHLDVDVYRSYKECLEFLYPRTVKGGLIMIDDYKVASAPGCSLALDEFLVDKPEKMTLFGDQWYFIKK